MKITGRIDLDRRADGFTLIEIVLVIVILGIIAAIALPRMGAVTEGSKVAATRAEMNMLKRAIIGNANAIAGGRYVEPGFEGDVGHPPLLLTELGIKPDTLAEYNRFTRRGWNGPYIDTAAADYLTDAWGASYLYYPDERKIVSIGGEDSLMVTF